MPKKKPPPPQAIRPRNEKYRFDLWSDGKWHKLTHGVDFEPPLESFRSGVCAYCRRHGLQVTTKKPPCPKGQPQVLIIKIVNPLQEST